MNIDAHTQAEREIVEHNSSIYLVTFNITIYHSDGFFPECSVAVQNWLCLQCGVVNCGRYVEGHAKQHAETMDHQLCMSCDAYSVYW